MSRKRRGGSRRGVSLGRVTEPVGGIDFANFDLIVLGDGYGGEILMNPRIGETWVSCAECGDQWSVGASDEVRIHNDRILCDVCGVDV